MRYPNFGSETAVRKLTKENPPDVLVESASVWTEDFIADPDSNAKRFRYRHTEIKSALMRETGSKCIYCESKLGHNTPGDVEHKLPTVTNPRLHFDWSNLTTACTVCNNLKRAYDDATHPFLDPYVDDVEGMLVHHGPIVGWRPDCVRAEKSVRVLGLHDHSRIELVMRKIEKLADLNEIVSRRAHEDDQLLKVLLTRKIEEMQDRSSEYSAMIVAACNALG